MARPSRVVVPVHPHHVTQRGVRSLNVFHEESNRGEHLGMLGLVENWERFLLSSDDGRLSTL